MTDRHDAGIWLAVNYRPEIDTILEEMHRYIPRRHRYRVGQLCGILVGIAFSAGYKYARTKLEDE